MVPQGSWHVFIPVGPQDRLSRWTLDFTIGEVEYRANGRMTLPPSGVVCLRQD
ncbi:hypothetical protein ACQYRI_19615 [Salmonella enterica]